MPAPANIPGVPSTTPKPAPVLPPTPVPTFDAPPTWGGMAQRPPVNLDVNKQMSDEAQKNAPIQYVTDADIEKAKTPTQADFELARKNFPGQPSATIEARAREYARKRSEDLAFTKNKQQGYVATSNNAPQEPLKNPTVAAGSRGSVSETPTGKVPAQTGNPAVDKAIKKFDTKGTDVKKLENFWDKVAKFFTGQPEGDVTIWDFLEATGRAMAKNDQQSTRTIRRDQQREERLMKQQQDAELAAKQADRAWQEQQNALQRNLQLQLAGLRGAGGAPVNPAALGAQVMGVK